MNAPIRSAPSPIATTSRVVRSIRSISLLPTLTSRVGRDLPYGIVGPRQLPPRRERTMSAALPEQKPVSPLPCPAAIMKPAHSGTARDRMCRCPPGRAQAGHPEASSPYRHQRESQDRASGSPGSAGSPDLQLPRCRPRGVKRPDHACEHSRRDLKPSSIVMGHELSCLQSRAANRTKMRFLNGPKEARQVHLSRRRYARKLLDAFAAEAAIRGVRRIWVQSHDFQAPGLYEKAGFVRVAEFADWPEGHSNVILCRTLEATTATP